MAKDSLRHSNILAMMEYVVCSVQSRCTSSLKLPPYVKALFKWSYYLTRFKLFLYMYILEKLAHGFAYLQPLSKILLAIIPSLSPKRSSNANDLEQYLTDGSQPKICLSFT